MKRATFHLRVSHHRAFAPALLVLAVLFILPGCAQKKPPPPPVTSHYQELPAKEVPDYLRQSIFERVDVVDVNPKPVSAFALVADLKETGDTRASNVVRQWMIKQMEKRGFGSRTLGYGKMTPEVVLSDPHFAIARLDAFIPPGARKGDRIDVQVSCMPTNNTTSLAGGVVYRAELKEDGANPRAPGIGIDTWAFVEGGIFVNPAYALQTDPTTPEARASLRVGVVMGGGVVNLDRAIFLRLRQPSYQMSRAIEYRLDEFFQDSAIASAMDDGVVRLYMPRQYKGDWEHFVGVVQHVFFNNAPQFATLKSHQLAAEAEKQDAPLLDISYCWEALGPRALPFVEPLMTHQKPEIAFAAARACAFLGDSSAVDVLVNMARQREHPFRINAVQTLAALPSSPIINGMLRTLMNSDQMLVPFQHIGILSLEFHVDKLSRPLL